MLPFIIREFTDSLTAVRFPGLPLEGGLHRRLPQEGQEEEEGPPDAVLPQEEEGKEEGEVQHAAARLEVRSEIKLCKRAAETHKTNLKSGGTSSIRDRVRRTHSRTH